MVAAKATSEPVSQSDSRTQVTFKYGPGYEDPWITISGTPQDILDQINAFEALELDSRVIAFSNAIHAEYLVSKPDNRGGLGGQRISGRGITKTPPPKEPEAKAEEKPTEPPSEKDTILLDISEAGTKAALAKVAKNHNDAFAADDELRDAYRKRLAELEGK